MGLPDVPTHNAANDLPHWVPVMRTNIWIHKLQQDVIQRPAWTLANVVNGSWGLASKSKCLPLVVLHQQKAPQVTTPSLGGGWATILKVLLQILWARVQSQRQCYGFSMTWI